MPLAKNELVTTVTTHINELAIHKLMKQIEKIHNIPPCSNIKIYLAMLQVNGLITKLQAKEIENYYKT